MAETEETRQFSIGITMPTSFLPRTRPLRQTRGIKRKYESEIINKQKFVLLEKKLLLPCPYLDLELKLINTKHYVWKRAQILKSYINIQIIPRTVNSLSFEQSLPFIVPNPYQKYIDFLKDYILLESRCRWQFKKLLNIWLYKKYNNRLFNTTDPFTCDEPTKPLYLYNSIQRGSYIFDAYSLKKHFETSLKTSEYMIPTPKTPTNPFTNLPFTLCQQISIIKSLKDCQSWAINGYTSVGYKLCKFNNKFNIPLRCEIIDEFCNNPQLDESKEHMIEFMEYIFDMYDIDTRHPKMKIIKWGINKSYNDTFVKSWRKIYKEYHYILYQYPNVDLNDLLYESVFNKINENLDKLHEFKRMAEGRLYETIA